jgi:colicin import membrane protein
VQTSEPTPPDIALEEARKKREQEQKEREAAEAAKQKARLEAERKQAQLQEAQRLEDQRRAAEKRAAEDAAQKAAAEKAAAEKAAAEKKAKEEAAKKAAADKALRDAFRNDALDAAGIAGGTADRNQAGGGRDDGYGAKIRACVQPGVAYPPPPRSGSANPTAQYRVQLNAHGQVMGIALMRSSGIPGFDRAVETGIRRCDPFPKPTTGRYEPIIDVVYRMYD